MPFQQEDFMSSCQPITVAPPPHVAASRQYVQLDLAAEVLRRFGEVQIVEMGRSMIPSIYPGDLLTIRSGEKSAVRCGDIVLHLRAGRFCVHRVTRTWQESGTLMFATWGDAAVQQDPPFDENQLLGRVTAVVRRGKPVEFAQKDTLRMKALRHSVRKSQAFATFLLRWHLLHTRILRGALPAFEHRRHRSEDVLECL
jgi:signal peptidase I